MLDTTDNATNSRTHPAASTRTAQRETAAWSPPGIGPFALGLASSGVCLLRWWLVVALSLSWVGVGLTLPYYGAEAFGLHAVGQRTLTLGGAGLLKPLTHAIRWEAGIYFIIAGLLLLALGVVIAAVAVWRSECLQPWRAVPFACGLVLYIPQFAAPQVVRIAHGALMLAGCWWLAWANARPLAPPRSARAMERNSIEASTR
jgi:hypothetical protein